METVYNKTVSTKSDELFQFGYPWHRFTGTTFYIVLFILQSTRIVFIYAKKAMEMWTITIVNQ